MSRRSKTGSALPDLTRTGVERPFPGAKAQAGHSFGGSSGVAFRDTVYPAGDRANVMFLLPSDSRYYLTGWTRYRINQKVEWLWQTFGIVKELGAGIARHTVGKGAKLVIESSDPDFAKAAEADFAEYAISPDRCDIAGRRDFYDYQNFSVQQYLYRGESFAGHVDNPRWGGAPAFQFFDSQEITSPSKGSDDDIVDGVRVGEYNEALEYFVRALGDDVKPIPAGKMMHWFKPHTAAQVRGISHFAQAVNGLVDFHELQRLETRTAKAHKLVALVMKGVGKKKTRGAFGAVEKSGSSDPDVPNKDTADLERIYGGAGAGIAYLDAEGDVKLVTSNTPSPFTEEFITNLLMRDVSLAPGVPMEFFWNIGKLGGANVRFILSKADLFFQCLLEDMTQRMCTPLAFRYLQHRIKTGKLPKPKDPNWRIAWQGPRRITVDNGNDHAARLANLAGGVTTLKREYGDQGENWVDQTRQWIREPIKFLQLAAEELKASGLPPEMVETILARWSANVPIWRAGQPGATGLEPDGDEDKDPEDDKKKPSKKDAEDDDDDAPPAAPAKKK